MSHSWIYRRCWLRSALVMFGLALMWAGSARAQDSGKPSPSIALDKAEELFRLNRLLDAAPLYQQALRTKDPEQKRRCYDRLLSVYVRLGRQDEAIRIGRDFQEFLRRVKDPSETRNLALQMGLCYHALGHVEEAARHMNVALAEKTFGPPLPAPRQMTALIVLAAVADRRGERAQVADYLRQLEFIGLRQLRQDAELSASQRAECVWKLAEGYRLQNQGGKAIPHLRKLAEVLAEAKDYAGQVETLRLLAVHEAQEGRVPQAEKIAREALQVHHRHSSNDRLTAADLATMLAELARRQKHADDEKAWRQQALEDYQQVVKEPRLVRAGQGGAVTAFWKMQALLQEARQYRQALQLATSQAEQWAGGSLVQTKLQAEQGGLGAWAGLYQQSRSLLRPALAELRTQDPVNLIELPRALVNLAISELATDELVQAERLAKECQALYRDHRLPDDLLILESDNILGNCAALNGEYALAVDRFRSGLERCKKVGAGADPQQANILLNLALLHKAQGDADEAARHLGLARAVFAKFVDADDLSHAALDAALANLYLAQGRIKDAAKLSERILALAEKHQIDRGPLVTTARHCQALEALRGRDFAQADRLWTEILALQDQEKQAILMPRTLNYLGLSAELQDKWDQAEAYLNKASGLQRDNPRAFPATHFITLWRLANVADHKKQREVAKKHLQEAIAVVERARFLTFGDAQQRSGYYAQFAPAFDQLVEWSVRDGDVEGALAAIARGRSRAFLDQLQMANVDPRVGLENGKDKVLLPREAELRKKLSALRAKAMLMTGEELASDQAKKLLASFDEAQKDYAEVWREIINANPVYRSLGKQDLASQTVELLRQRILGDKKLLLVYHLGKNKSHLILVGPKTMETFPLETPAEVAERAEPVAVVQEEAGAGTRGLVLKPRAKLPSVPAAPAAATPGPLLPLGQALARSLVEQYRNEIAHPEFTTTRGLVLKPRDAQRPVPTQRLDLLGNIFLPPAARKRIQEQAPEMLVVVPDGPLHKLPLEALLIEAGAKARYVLDDMPPMVYAPSIAALTVLAQRPSYSALGPMSLLTVGNPAYPQTTVDPKVAAASSHRHVLGLQGQLPLLPHTAAESKKIQGHFNVKDVVALDGALATERAVVKALGGKRVIHIAVHGFADERFGNLFGALALTPPQGKIEPENDGFLSLHEIYSLPLKDCDLAVLSACSTYVGPQQPLEAGVTLASGFLAAGARRVVASHWSVDDRSTAELMGEFFAEVAAGQKQGLNYAQALQRARQRIRANPNWSSPFYWAPFVLIGPAE